MTTPVTGIELRIGTEGVARGRDEFVGALERARDSARSFSSVQQQLRADFERLRDEFRQGGLSQDEFTAQQKDLIAAMSQVGRTAQKTAVDIKLLEALDRVGPAGRSAAQGLGLAARSTSSAGQGFEKLRGPLQAVVFSMAGVPGPAGRLATSLASFAAGGALAVGVAAGIGAIALAWREFRKEQEDANERVERGIVLFEQLTSRRRLLKDYQETLAQTALAEADLRQALSQLDALRGDTSGAGRTAIAQLTDDAAAAREELQRLGQALSGFSTQLGPPGSEFGTRPRDTGAAERRLAALRQVRDLELDVADLLAGRVNDALRQQAVERERQRNAIADQVAQIKGLNTAEKERLQTLLQQVDALRTQQDLLAFSPRVVGQTAGTTAAGLGQPLQLQASDLSDLAGVLERFNLVTGQTRQITQASTSAAEDEIAARERLIRQTSDVIGGVLSLASSLGVLDDRAADIVGGLAQAGVGIATGDVGSIVSGGLKVLGGIFGGGGESEADRRQREAIEDVRRSIDQFVESLRPIGSALDELERKYAEQIAAAQAAGVGQREIIEAYIAARERLEAQIAKEQQQVQEDLRVREQSALGNTALAATLRQLADQQREFERALTEGYDEATIALLEHVHALEREQLVRDQAIAAAQKAQESLQSELELLAREAAVRGDASASAAIRLQAEAEAERFRARQLLESGAITQAFFDRLVGVINDELAQAVDDLTTAYEEQAAAAAQLIANFEDDLRVRDLRLQGRDKEADALERSRERRAEIEAALALGVDAAGIAELERIQILEEQKAITEDLVAETKALSDALQREAEIRSDLRERELRAQGRDEAADAVAQFFRDSAELAKLAAEGVSQDLIDETRRIQGLERNRREELNQARQQQAFDAAVAANFSVTSPSFGTPSVNLAVGVSESTANRLAGLSGAQLAVQQQYLPLLAVIANHLAVIASQSGDLEAQLAGSAAAEARTLGLNPGNV